MSRTATFGDWYKARLGHRPVLVQGIVWFLYGFIWIPIWYVNTRDLDRGGASSASDAGPATPDFELAQPWRRLIGYLVDIALGVGLGVAFVSSGHSVHPSSARLGRSSSW